MTIPTDTPLGWMPPVMLVNYEPRVVTQADVDEWILIACRYRELVRIVRDDVLPLMPKPADG